MEHLAGDHRRFAMEAGEVTALYPNSSRHKIRRRPRQQMSMNGSDVIRLPTWRLIREVQRQKVKKLAAAQTNSQTPSFTASQTFEVKSITPEERQQLLSRAIHVINFPSPSYSQVPSLDLNAMLNKAPCRKFIKRGASTEEDDIDVEMEEQCIAPPPRRILKKPVLTRLQSTPSLPLPPIFSPLSTSTTDLSNNFLEDKALQETLPTIAYSKKKRMPSQEDARPPAQTLGFSKAEIQTPPPSLPHGPRKKTGAHTRGLFSRGKPVRKAMSLQHSEALSSSLNIEAGQMPFGFTAEPFSVTASLPLPTTSFTFVSTLFDKPSYDVKKTCEESTSITSMDADSLRRTNEALHKEIEALKAQLSQNPNIPSTAPILAPIRGVHEKKFRAFCQGGNEDGEIGRPKLHEKRNRPWSAIRLKSKGSNDDEDAMIDIPLLLDVACGSMNSVAITEHRKLMTWGHGASSGQNEEFWIKDDASTEGDGTRAFAKIIVPDTNFMRVAASEVAGFALDENGQLWAWGRFRDVDGGSFFLQDRPIVSEPVNVSHLFGLMRIIDIAVGHNFMLYLTEDGCVHGWGVTSLGSLGPDFPNGRVALPSPRINLPDGFTVDRLFAGGYNTFILGTYSCGRKAILACGNNKEGELGVGILNSIKEWTEVSFKDFVNFDVGKVVEIAVGLEHTLFRTIDGEVYGCGTDRNGELGLEKGHMRNFCLPAKINVEPAIMVSTGAGGFHSYVVSKDAEVFVAGANTHWQLRYHGAAGGEELITKFSCREFVVQDEKRDVVFATGGIQFSVWGLEQD